jgi:hypothetical protein
MLAVHLENLLFLLLLVVAGLFQLLSRVASKTRQEGENSEEEMPRSISTSRTRPPIPRAPAETDEERVRKFLEALGQPSTSKPPPRATPRPTYPKPFVLPRRPPLASPLPPLTTRPPDLPPEISLPEPIPPTREEKGFTPRVAEAALFEVHEGPLPVEPLPIIKTPLEAYATATRPVVKKEESKTDIAILLTSKASLRGAIILREILGPPRGLRMQTETSDGIS